MQKCLKTDKISKIHFYLVICLQNLFISYTRYTICSVMNFRFLHMYQVPLIEKSCICVDHRLKWNSRRMIVVHQPLYVNRNYLVDFFGLMMLYGFHGQHINCQIQFEDWLTIIEAGLKAGTLRNKTRLYHQKIRGHKHLSIFCHTTLI